ncbi:MAG: hypothetical protein HWE39_24200 [Oceanospirillaceae bacterium]|nr:hypothetical protein [Oceanospirillaceae bacterium]
MKKEIKILTIDKNALSQKLPEANKKQIEFCQIFLNEILQRQSVFSANDNRFMTFSYDTRKKMMPLNYINKVETDLVDLGLVEKDSTYSKSQNKAQGFRLTDDFFDQELAVDSIVQKPVLNRYRRYSSEREDRYDIDLSDSINTGLIKNCRKFKINFPNKEIDFTGKVSFSEPTTTLIGNGKDNHYVYHFLEENKSKKESILKLAQLLKANESGQYFVKHDEDRLYTKWTNLPRDFRKYLEFNANPLGLVQLDISCSQPVILAGLVYNAINRTITEEVQDVVEYMDLAMGGDLYNAFTNYDRDSAKKGILYLLSGNIEYPQFKELYEVFKSSFPTVWNYLKELKSEDYRNSSKVLRTEEASLILKDVCGELINLTAKDFAFLTIHDAIIVPKNYAGLVSSVVRRKFSDKYGFECFLKEEQVTDSTADISEYFVADDYFKTNGYSYHLLCANQNLAIYGQRNDALTVGYEVHINRFKKNTLPDGKTLEKWFRPSSEQWGKLGKTTYSLGKAMKIYSKLVNSR